MRYLKCTDSLSLSLDHISLRRPLIIHRLFLPKIKKYFLAIAIIHSSQTLASSPER